MSKLKIAATALIVSRILLVVFIAILILVIPQLNIEKYVLPTITSKMIYFLYGSLILLGLYSLSIIFPKAISFSFSKIDIALFILVFYITLNRYFIQSHYGFSIRYIELLGLSFFYVVLRHISLKNYPWLLLSIVVSGIIQAVYGNLQLLGYYVSNHSGFKMTGSFFNPGPYAGFLVSVWTVALGMYLFRDTIIIQMQSQKKSNSQFLNEVLKYTFEYIPLLGLISIAIVLPALQSRASWIAALVGSYVLLELKYHFLKNIFKKVTATFQKTAFMLLSVGILSAGLFSLYHYKKGSSDGRAFIWKVTTEMIADAPVFGLGFDRFKAEYMNYQANYFAKNGETAEALVADNTYYAFNEGLQFVAENGFVGLVLLLIIIYFIFQINVKEKHRLLSLIVKTGLLTIAVFACFSYPMQILPIKMVLIFLVAILSNSASPIFQFKIEDYSRKQWAYKISLALLTYIAIHKTYGYTTTLNQGFMAWNNALNSHQYGDYNAATQEFELAYPVFKKDGDFLMNYGKTLSMAGEPHKAIAVLEQAKHYQNNTVIASALGDSYKAIKQYEKAEVTYQQAINMTPGKFYANYLLAKLYDVSGQEGKAVTMAKKLLNKEIKIPSTAIKEIHEEMKKILIKYKKSSGI
ncbi:O-antigen ligase family protein [Flavobacterium daejeonense]|uniref:O-antigen ligase family protein n=1 Tax=Flavobacterium daejeonense TaxID=350893 RepID=UPI00047A5708|nr:O-antigen ligase family protein [Flavobacterium daejeonense]